MGDRPRSLTMSRHFDMRIRKIRDRLNYQKINKLKTMELRKNSGTLK
jgi:hypothetical protein